MNSELVAGAIWTAIGIAFILGMLSQVRIWSLARDARRIADALEAATLQNERPHFNGTNKVRDFLE